jgi:hypothetical protein
MKLKLALAILWLSILFAGSIYAQDEDQVMELSDQDMLGAYPEMPTTSDQTGQQLAMGYPGGLTSAVSSQQQMTMAYPSDPTSMPGTTLSMPGTTLSMPGTPTSGIAAAYPGMPTTGGTATAIYSTTAPPSAQQNVLLPYNVQASPPSAVYYSGGFMPWTTFNTMFPSNQPMLWVATTTGWGWYAASPIGGWLQNQMFIPYTGTLKIYELYPDGSVKPYNYGWSSPGWKYIWFYADTPGRHITLFTITDRPSNYITVDVY